jgi:hypothetical protein
VIGSHGASGIPVLVVDTKTFLAALKEDKTLQGKVDQLKALHGGVYTITNLNIMTKDQLNNLIKTIRSETQPVPSYYYDKSPPEDTTKIH